MVFAGVFANTAAILVGCILGRLVKVADDVRDTITQGLGLAVCLIGFDMALESQQFLIPIAALAMGGTLGATLDLEGRLERIGVSLGNKLGHSSGDFSNGFMTATLVFCVGAMAVIGSLNSGLYNDHQVLYAKAILDGLSSIFFTASFGIGVAFSAVSVFIYQGSIALLARLISPLFNEAVLAELSSTGGLLVFALGLNMVGATKIRAGNLLPSIILAVILAAIFA